MRKFYEDEHGNLHGTNQDNDGWLESGAPNRHKLYKDLGIKVICNREDVHVEVSGERLFLDSESPS
jgi:hypothetical protein